MTLSRRDIGRMAIGTGALAMLPGGMASAGATTIAHGVSAFGDLKYPPDFSNFDYADPQAAVGGTFSTGYGGTTFDSLADSLRQGADILSTCDSSKAGSCQSSSATCNAISVGLGFSVKPIAWPSPVL